MRITIFAAAAAAIIAAATQSFASPGGAAGASISSLVAGQGWGSDENGFREDDILDDNKPGRKAGRAGIFVPAPYAFALHFGGMIPIMASETDYTAGPAFGVGLRIPFAPDSKAFFRINIDAGSISASEDKWSSSSTVLIGAADMGYDARVSSVCDLSLFVTAGVLAEMFSGTENSPLGEKTVSETNLGPIAGFGLGLRFSIAGSLNLEFGMRLAFPIASRNVKSILLPGVTLAFEF